MLAGNALIIPDGYYMPIFMAPSLSVAFWPDLCKISFGMVYMSYFMARF